MTVHRAEIITCDAPGCRERLLAKGTARIPATAAGWRTPPGDYQRDYCPQHAIPVAVVAVEPASRGGDGDA